LHLAVLLELGQLLLPVLRLMLLLQPVRWRLSELLLLMLLPEWRLLKLRLLRRPLLLRLHAPRLSVRLHSASARLPSWLSEGLEAAGRQVDGARRCGRQLRRRRLRAAHAVLAA
jgi:hypothetical protein